jgi:DNA gyrase subunit A
MGRPAYGVRGMDLDKGDYIVGMAVTPKPGKAPAVPTIEAKLEAAEAGGEKTDGKADGKSGAKSDKAQPAKKTEPAGAIEHPTLILSVTENGYGKRTPVEEYRLQSRGGKGVINVKTTARNGMVVGILLVDEKSEAMLISHYGKIIRIDTKQIREAGRSTQGVRLLSLDAGDKVAAAVVIPLEEEDANGTLLQ